jgi:integrase
MPWSRTAIGQRLGEIRKKTGLPLTATLHGLRHLLATEWIAAGGSRDLLAAFLGHASSKITEEFYVHREDMEPEILEQAARCVGRRKGGAA